MKSPTTGKEMPLSTKLQNIDFRKESFEIIYHYYFDGATGDQFTDDKTDELNMNQVYNQYRELHHLPFADEIISMRERYGLPASKMAEVLGFGVNVYRNYEAGEVPSESNARLIQLARDPEEFKKLLLLSRAYEGKEEAILNKVNELIEEEKENFFAINLEEYLFGTSSPTILSGYRKPSLEKFTEMVVFFTEQLQPWKTKLNKLLFYADFLNFRKTCYSISGTQYRAIDMGPVPNNFNSVFEYLANKDDIDIYQTEFPDGKIGEQFKPCGDRKFNGELFNKVEIETLSLVCNQFKNVSTANMINISHEEKAWIENFKDGKKLISYNYGFELKGV